RRRSVTPAAIQTRVPAGREIIAADNRAPTAANTGPQLRARTNARFRPPTESCPKADGPPDAGPVRLAGNPGRPLLPEGGRHCCFRRLTPGGAAEPSGTPGSHSPRAARPPPEPSFPAPGSVRRFLVSRWLSIAAVFQLRRTA